MDGPLRRPVCSIQRGKTLWTERGVYNVAGLKPGGNYLELCSGDGFNTFHYYRPFARSITAVDFDETALRHAREYNDAENIEFRKADIRTEFPVGQYDNILWDAAIEHFTEDEIASIMGNIKASLKPGGILSGYTLVEPEDGGKHLHHHEREFHFKGRPSRVSDTLFQRSARLRNHPPGTT